MLKEKTPHPAFSYLIYLGCAIAFCMIPFGSSTGRNIFYIASYIAFIAICVNLKFYIKNRINLILPLCLFCAGLGTILWMTHFKQQGEYINIYRAYMATGRLLIATAFILLIALNERICMQRWFIGLALFAGLLINFYVIYQGLWLDAQRAELNFDRATIAAYIITATNLAMMQAILMLRTRYRIPLYILGFALSFAVIILTGTRAAMLVYPVAICLSILATKDLISTKHKIILVISLPILLAICGFALKSQIEQRIIELRDNLAMVQTPGEDNSVMSRISMQIVGLQTGNMAPLGQSAEQRGGEILSIVAQHPELSGALPYTTVHLHNEILETYSLKGAWGVALLLVLYISLVLSALRPYRNTLLLALTFSLFAYGLSDVILFSTEGTVMFCLAIILSVLSVNKIKETQD